VLRYYILQDQMELISYKANSVTYSECVSVTLVIQHTKHVRYIVVCVLSDFSIFVFPQYVKRDTIFGKCHRKQNVCFDFLYNFFSNIFHYKKN